MEGGSRLCLCVCEWATESLGMGLHKGRGVVVSVTAWQWADRGTNRQRRTVETVDNDVEKEGNPLDQNLTPDPPASQEK